MLFYYENNMDDYGLFKEKDLIKAIYTSWNIEANLYLVDENKLSNKRKLAVDEVLKYSDLIFCPLEDNEFNSDLLKEFGYYMKDGEKYREIVNIKTKKIERYDFKDVKQLV